MLARYTIQKILREWKAECGITNIILFRYTVDGELIIYSDKVGIMIGYMGERVARYTDKFKKIDKDFKKISFWETNGIA